MVLGFVYDQELFWEWLRPRIYGQGFDLKEGLLIHHFFVTPPPVVGSARAYPGGAKDSSQSCR